jgi:uncharacterized protein YhfF
MDDDQDVTPSDDHRINAFWAVAHRYADIGDLDVVMGRQWGEAVPPPAWSFGDSPDMADRLLGLVLEGRKTATSGLYQEYVDSGQPLPKVGDLSIIVDGSGRPGALVRDVEVQTVPFGDVTPAQATAEGEGDCSLDSWREGHREFWLRDGYEVGDGTLVVWERFKVLYSPLTRER